MRLVLCLLMMFFVIMPNLEVLAEVLVSYKSLLRITMSFVRKSKC